jgi:Cys-tRNA(Pro)/Cys-tRNA(Cys) deacylase
MGKKPSAGTRATQLLADAGIWFAVHRYDHDPAAPSYGWEAVDRLGVDPSRVFKTVLVSIDGHPTVAVVPVMDRLALKAVAAAVGGKRAAMVEPTEAERLTGYVVGGISPVGQRRRLLTVLDESVKQFETVYVSAGGRGVEIELSPGDLIAVCEAVVSDIAEPGERRS